MTEQEKIDLGRKEVLDFLKNAFCIDGKAQLVEKDNLKIKAAVELNDSKRGRFYIGILEEKK